MADPGPTGADPYVAGNVSILCHDVDAVDSRHRLCGTIGGHPDEPLPPTDPGGATAIAQHGLHLAGGRHGAERGHGTPGAGGVEVDLTEMTDPDGVAGGECHRAGTRRRRGGHGDEGAGRVEQEDAVIRRRDPRRAIAIGDDAADDDLPWCRLAGPGDEGITVESCEADAAADPEVSRAIDGEPGDITLGQAVGGGPAGDDVAGGRSGNLGVECCGGDQQQGCNQTDLSAHCRQSSVVRSVGS